MKPKVLVFLGTSRQGAAVVDALLASDKFEVYATTRSAKSAEALKAKGVKCGPFTCGDAASAKAALDAAEPSLVFFTTLMGSREVEGSLVYTLELKGELYHELLALTINRGKLFRVSTVTSNRKWDKREKLYRNIVASFVPQGY